VYNYHLLVTEFGGKVALRLIHYWQGKCSDRLRTEIIRFFTIQLAICQEKTDPEIRVFTQWKVRFPTPFRLIRGRSDKQICIGYSVRVGRPSYK